MCEAEKRGHAEGKAEFAERARQILSTEPILTAKDVEVKFTLRDRQLTAIRRCSLDLYDGRRWRSWANPDRARACSRSCS